MTLRFLSIDFWHSFPLTYQKRIIQSDSSHDKQSQTNDEASKNEYRDANHVGDQPFQDATTTLTVGKTSLQAPLQF